MRSFYPYRVAVAVLTVWLALSSTFTPAPAGADFVDDGDEINVIHGVEIDKEGKTKVLPTQRIPDRNFRIQSIQKTPAAGEGQPRAPFKIHPRLEELMDKDPDGQIAAVITLKDDVKVPRFPDIPHGATRDSAAGKRVLEEREKLIEQLRATRVKQQESFLAKMEQSGIKVDVQEQFWIVNAFLAEINLADVKRLASLDEVTFIQPRASGEEPPDHDGNSRNDIVDARARIGSDTYFNLGLTSGYIGLLDTGIRIPAHDLMNPPIGSPFFRDCVHGNDLCEDTGDPMYSANDVFNHGTASASILQADSSKGAAFRGMTEITVDIFNVYFGSGLDSAAAVRGVQGALAVGDSVIVYVMGGVEPQGAAIAAAADNAYDAGAINIAASGNTGDYEGFVKSPALAHKVIGVGAYDVESGDWWDGSGRGPTTDGRIKPELIAPSFTEAASTDSASAMQTFENTSGATPYAGGAAMLSYNFMRQVGTIDNGHVYARLILSGQERYPFSNQIGAGKLSLPACSRSWWGKVTMDRSNQVIDIPLTVALPYDDDFAAALWWPESLTEAHDDVDLRLVDPSGRVADLSVETTSIFERLQASGPLAPGTWLLRINGWSIRSGPQTVYWAAAASSWICEVDPRVPRTIERS